LEIPNNAQAEAEATADDEKQEKDESLFASSSTTYSGHAKPSEAKEISSKTYLWSRNRLKKK
jgi:hypothetical protein